MPRIWTWSIVGFVVLATVGCRPARDAAFEPPGRLRLALARVTDLTATAEVVPMGAAPLEGQPLQAGDDGTSFSGFIDLDPGTYTVEIVFSGRFDGSDILFLGRWASTSFTVVQGDAAAPSFNTPLDTIGRAGDGGDEDNDGLGLLDELLFGSDPALPDSDNDGIADGDDCRPTMTSTGRAVQTGQLEDCDGDGELRPDRPVGVAGRDCNDEDPTINPAAQDVCGDGIDQDCNPETCPDESRPVITILDPAPGQDAGCEQTVRATIASEIALTSTELLFVDDRSPPNTIDTLTMRSVGNDTYVSPPLADTSVWLDPGSQRYLVRATDMRGMTTTATQTMNLVLEVPVATMTPMTVGRRDTPFELVVAANATAGIGTIVLYQAAVVDDEVIASSVVEIARSTTSPLRHTIDPTTLADGQYAFLPVVTDAVGNQLAAKDDFIPDLRLDNTLGTDATYACLFDSGEDNVPVRILEVSTGGPILLPAKMKDHLAEAITLAAARDPAAVPVEIRGFGILPNGTVPLDETTGGGGKRWRYVFFNFTDDRRIEVTWYSLADRTDSPVVEVTESDPFGSSFSPFTDLNAVADSDVIAAAYTNAAGCEALTGATNDDLRYENDDPFSTNDVVHITGGNTSWKATATVPVTEIFMCE